MQLPKEFTEEMSTLLGEEFEPFLGSFSLPAAKAFRLNPNKPCTYDLSEACDGKVPFDANAFFTKSDWLGSSPLHHAGAYYMQEPSAMLPAAALAPKAGYRVLDLCAAPGGKSSQLSAMIGDNGILVANEINAARSRILLGNIERLGIKNTVVTNLPPAELAKHARGWFDAVLVDAPCSGEGMFRKNPEAIGEWSPAGVTACSRRQQEILALGGECLKEGGLLLYSTCTFSKAEDEDIAEALVKNGGFELLDIPKQNGISQGLDTNGYCARLYPHKLRGEGHFAALFRKTRASETTKSSCVIRQLTAKEKNLCNSFFHDNLTYTPQVLAYNNNLVIPPAQLPPIPYGIIGFGVKVGELSDRLQPHHQFFSAYPHLFTEIINLPLSDDRIKSYIAGEEIQAPTLSKSGWGVLCVEACALGGVKISCGRAKNYYPKGLRKRL